MSENAAGRAGSSGRALLAYVPLVLVTLALGVATTRAVLALAGGPAVPLDDTYIHFQYARSFAELRAFRYTEGAAPTPGATSLLWPLALSPLYAAGLRRELLIYAAWLLGWASLALLALETKRLAEGLVRPAVAVAAGAMVLAFGGYTWFAASGMEVVPFAWLLTRAFRRAVEFVEHPSAGRGASPRVAELVLLSALCPLMRPEGAIASVVTAVALAASGRGRADRSQGFLGAALVTLACPLLPPLVCLLATGQAVASTAMAKWLPLNPYYRGEALFQVILGNAGIFFGTLLDGRIWASVFLPAGGREVALLALPALVVLGRRKHRMTRAFFVLVLAISVLIPTTYETFLVNRVRYIWPFAAAWFVGLAALAQLAGDVVERGLLRLGVSVPHLQTLLAWALVALLASRLPPSIADVAASARAITLQQVSLARWSKDNLPPHSLVGVNDTGATAYFGDHPTFDVVGLTTAAEARYWTAGPGSRFEHYETLPKSALPTHYLVYPEWFAIDALLDRELASRFVEHTILGGSTMVAYTARYQVLGSGQAPLSERFARRRLVDSLDVADLASERAHGYALLDATQARNLVVEDEGRADGGRTERRRDRFQLRLAPGGTLVARWGSRSSLRVTVSADDKELAVQDLAPGNWHEVTIAIPGGTRAGVSTVEVTASAGTFDSLHYWSYE